MRILQPGDWPAPKGYSNGVAAVGEVIHVAGQVGWDRDGRFVAGDFAGQLEQALRNVLLVLAEAGAGPEHVVRMTWFLTDRRAYLDDLRNIGAIYRSLMGRNFPAMTAVQVVALMEDAALIEIEATAVLPAA